MSLKQIDLVRLDGLNQTAIILNNAGFTPDATHEAMKDQITEFEVATKNKVEILDHQVDGSFIKLTSLRKDYLRTRKPNDSSLVLRTVVQSVPIEVKLVKDGDYTFSNEAVVTSLRALADEVSKLTFTLSDLGNEDVRSIAREHAESAVDIGTDVVDQDEATEHASDLTGTPEIEPNITHNSVTPEVDGSNEQGPNTLEEEDFDWDSEEEEDEVESANENEDEYNR